MLFANDGGPLLLAPVSPKPLWEGGEVPSNGRVVKASSTLLQSVATDYDRACDVKDGAELLDAGGAWVVVIGGEVGEATWLTLSDRSFAVVGVDGWGDEPTPAAVRAHYDRVSHGGWITLGSPQRITGEGIDLMHAAGMPGAETRYEFSASDNPRHAVIGDAIRYSTSPGEYVIQKREHVQRRTAATPGEYAVLVRFTRHFGPLDRVSG